METIAANPDVFWTGEWKKDYKTVRAGSARASAKSTAPARWMHIGSLLTDDAGAADLRARLEALPATVRSAFPRIGGVSAVAFLTDAQIEAVASWPDVEWIEPQLKPRLFNDQAALPNMMNVASAWEAVSDGGLGLTGAGQVVAVADSGCDLGSTNDIHPDFAGRVKAAWGWTNGKYTASASWADTSGHGTHVCGSVLGNGAASTNLYRGMAWEAELVVQGCGPDLDGIPDDPLVMHKQAHLVGGACIHSDSWGYGPEQAGQYTATAIDDEGVLHYLYAAMYVDGYMWTNQNFIMVSAAGNNDTGTSGNSIDATVTTLTNSAFLAWLDVHDAPGHSPFETAPNTHIYWDNYLADIDPTNTNWLEFSFASPTNPTLSIVPFSPNRTYQLLYWTNLQSDPTNILLTPTNLFLPTDTTGFGRLRVTLPAPSP